MSSEFGEIMQLGYIVDDIKTAAAEWSSRLGIGPFYIIEGLPFGDSYKFRGQQTELVLDMAFAYWGEVQVELITPVNDTDNLYTQALKRAPGQLNHYATLVSDLDALLDRHKLHDRIIHSGEMASGLKFVYLEEFAPGGLHLELIQATPDAVQGFEGMKAVAKTWDGKNPVRSMMALGDDLATLMG